MLPNTEVQGHFSSPTESPAGPRAIRGGWESPPGARGLTLRPSTLLASTDPCSFVSVHGVIRTVALMRRQAH